MKRRTRTIIANVRFNLFLFTILSFTMQSAMGATYYVWSGATGAADGSSFTDAFTTLNGALSGKAAGDVFLISHQHSELSLNVTLTSQGTMAAPQYFVCVDQNTLTPTTGAVIGASNAINGNGGFVYAYGLHLQSGDTSNASSFNMQFGASTSAPWYWQMERCKLSNPMTGSSNNGILIGQTSPVTTTGPVGLELIDCEIAFPNTYKTITVRAPFTWRGTESRFTGTATCLARLTPTAHQTMNLRWDGVDLSALTLTTDAVIGMSTNRFIPGVAGQVVVQNCKLGGSPILVAGISTTGSVLGALGPMPNRLPVEFINCDDGDTNYGYYGDFGVGTIESETTITLTGGSTNGTLTTSRKMVTTASSSVLLPLVSPSMTFWNESTTSQTVSVEVITDGVTLYDGEAWLDVQYPGASGYPSSTVVMDRISTLIGTTSAQTTSTANWTTTGLASPTKQKLSASFTPLEAGLITARVVLAKPSTTMYYDPKILSTSARQYAMPAGVFVNEGAGGSSGGRPRIGGGLIR